MNKWAFWDFEEEPKLHGLDLGLGNDEYVPGLSVASEGMFSGLFQEMKRREDEQAQLAAQNVGGLMGQGLAAMPKLGGGLRDVAGDVWDFAKDTFSGGTGVGIGPAFQGSADGGVPDPTLRQWEEVTKSRPAIEGYTDFIPEAAGNYFPTVSGWDVQLGNETAAGAADFLRPHSWLDLMLMGAPAAARLQKGAQVGEPLLPRLVNAALEGVLVGPDPTSPLPAVPAVRRSVTEVPQFAPEAARVAETAGQTVTPRGIDTAPLGVKLAGAAPPPGGGNPGGITKAEYRRQRNAYLGSGNAQYRPPTDIREVLRVTDDMRVMGEGLVLDAEKLGIPGIDDLSVQSKALAANPKGKTAQQGVIDAQKFARQAIEEGDANTAFDRIADELAVSRGPLPRDRARIKELQRIHDSLYEYDELGGRYNFDYLRASDPAGAADEAISASVPAARTQAAEAGRNILSPAEAAALNAYHTAAKLPDEFPPVNKFGERAHHYQVINNGLRGSPVQLQPNDIPITLEGMTPAQRAWFDEQVSSLDGAIAKSSVKQDTTAYRGVAAYGHEDWIKSLRPGTRFTDKGFVSASTDPKVAKVFQYDGVILEFKVPKGSKAAGRSNAPGELLLPRNSEFKVISNDGQKVVLEYSPPQSSGAQGAPINSGVQQQVVGPSRSSSPPPAAPPGQPPTAATPPPPGKPPVATAKRIPEPADAIDGIIPGESVPDAAFRQYEGAIGTTARQERINLAEGAKKLRASGVEPGKDTPEMRQLYNALHGQGDAPEGLQPIFDDVKRLLSEEEAKTLDFDPRFQLHPDYMPRYWKQPKATRPGAATLGAKPGFVKPRVDASFQELLDAGYEPRSWNPYDLVAMRRQAGSEYREQSKLLDKLKGQGLVQDVVGPIPDGYRIPDVGGAVFAPKPYLDAAGEIRYTPPKMVPNGVANVLEQMFGRNLNWGTAGKVDLHGAASTITNAPKRIKLLGSFFQQMDFAARTGFASMGGAINDLMHGKPLSAGTKAARLPVSIGEMVAANLSPGRRTNLQKVFTSAKPVTKERPGMTWRMVSEQGLSSSDVSAFNKSMRDTLQTVIEEGKTAGARRIVNNINGAMERGLFEGVYPQAQKTAIENFIAPALARAHPDWTDKQLAASIAVEANKMFSTLPKSQSALRHVNRNITEATRMLIFSPNETESFLKATGSTFHGPNKQMWGEYWAGGLIFLTALAETIHLATTGEPLPTERLNPTTEGGPLGRTYNPRFLSPDVPLKGRGGTNMQLDLLMQMDTALRLLDPMSFLQARENVLLRAAGNQVSGKDFYGRPLDTPQKRIGQAASDVGLPIPAQQLTSVAANRFPALEGWIAEQEARLGPVGQTAQISGLNLRADTNRMVYDNMAKNAGLEDKNGKPATKWNQLTAAQQQEVLSRPENQQLAGELKKRGDEMAATGDIFAMARQINDAEREQKGQLATSIDSQLQSQELTGFEARKAYDKLVSDLASDKQARDKLLPARGTRSDLTEPERAERDYYAIFDKPGVRNEDETLNYNVYDKELANWQAKYPQYSKSDVSPARPLSPGHEELIKGRTEARPYFELQDKAFEKAQKDQPEMYGQYESLDEFRDAEVKNWVAQGMTRQQAEGIAQTVIDATLVDAKVEAIFYLFENPAQAAFLVKYGYYVPAAVKKIVELEQATQPAGVR